MDILRVDPIEYKPVDLIEGYNSMIWTERFSSAGEFEMKTPIINETLQAIPDGSLITHFDTDTLMIVESSIVEKNHDTGEIELTVKGRTAEVFLNQRNYGVESLPVSTPLSSRYQTVLRYPAQHMALWIYDRVVRQILPDVSVLNSTPSPVRLAEELLPNVSVSNSAPNDPGGAIYLAPDQGPLYDTLMKTANVYDLGLRVIRPTSSTPLRLEFADGYTGTITSSTVSNDTTLRFDIYKGTNLGASVIFDEEHNNLVDLSYLHQIKEYSNVAFIDKSPNWSNPDLTAQYPLNLDTVMSGWNRRVLYTSAQPIIDKYGNVTSPISSKALNDYVSNLLKEASRTEYYDCEIPSTSSILYRQHYNLGDIVQLRIAESQYVAVKITEYIRTEDQEGDRGFPTLVPV